jgi:hypothetical protein
VITLPNDKTLLLLIMLKVVVAGTPLVELTKVIVFVVDALVSVLLVTIDDVALTPLTVDVNVFPVATWVKLLIMLATNDVTPFTIV